MGAQYGLRFTMVDGRPVQSTEPHRQQQRAAMSVAAAVYSTQAVARAQLRNSMQVSLSQLAPSFDQMMVRRIESSSAQQ